MPLIRLRDPFDHPDWLYEIKHDGFRALAYIEKRTTALVSRNNHEFKSFAGLRSWLGENVAVRNAILDGEIVCLGPDGRAQFNMLLYRRQEPHFYAFDCLWLNGRDLRQLPLIERKRILRGIVPPQPSRLLYVDHVDATGVKFFQAVCGMDLEGIVAKLKSAPYGTEPPSWVKIKNPAYSQAEGRREKFDKMRARTATAHRRS